MTESEKRHKMPEGIKRVEKGVYVTADGRIEIRQHGDGGWRLQDLQDDDRFTLEPFKNRGQAVAWLAEHEPQALKAAEPEKPAKAEEPAKAEAKAEEPKEQPKRRPRTRKQPAKAVATA